MRLFIEEVKKSPKLNKKNEPYWWVKVQGQEKDCYCADIKEMVDGSEIEGEVTAKGGIVFLTVNEVFKSRSRPPHNGKDDSICRQTACKVVAMMNQGKAWSAYDLIVEAEIIADYMINGQVPTETTDVEPF